MTEMDDLVDLALDAANQWILDVCDLPGATQANYVDTLSVERITDTIFVRRRPIVSVTAVTDDGVLVSSDGYVVDNDLGTIRIKAVSWRRSARHRVQSWTPGVGTVEVAYAAGWATPSSELGLVQAANLVAALNVNIGPGVGKKTERLGQHTVSFFDPRTGFAIPASAAAAVDRFRRTFGR